jgi:hypothetical protein
MGPRRIHLCRVLVRIILRHRMSRRRVCILLLRPRIHRRVHTPRLPRISRPVSTPRPPRTSLPVSTTHRPSTLRPPSRVPPHRALDENSGAEWTRRGSKNGGLFHHDFHWELYVRQIDGREDGYTLYSSILTCAYTQNDSVLLLC